VTRDRVERALAMLFFGLMILSAVLELLGVFGDIGILLSLVFGVVGLYFSMTTATRGNAREILTGIHGIGIRLDGVTTRLDGLGSRVDAVGSRVDGVGSRVDAVGTRIDAVGTRLDRIGVRLDELAADVRVLHPMVTSLDDIKTLLAERLPRPERRG
jgi:hypothetical protein